MGTKTIQEDIDLINKSILSFIENRNLGETVRLKNLNEREYRFLMLNETMHYPEFLQEMYRGISDYVVKLVNGLDLTDEDIINRGSDFELSYDCQYFDSLWVTLKPYIDGSKIYEKSAYKSDYDTSCRFMNGKLINPRISVVYPVSRKGNTNSVTIHTRVEHEMTHLYDDWATRKAKYNKLLSDKGADEVKDKNFPSCIAYAESDVLIRELSDRDFGRLGYWLSNLLYLLHSSEKKAYITQTVTELESIGCNEHNRDKCIYSTSAYRNYMLTRNNVVKCIMEASDEELSEINRLSDGNLHPNSSLPHMDVFNPSEYRQKLLDMSENVFRSFMKKYGGIVRYYFDQLIREGNICSKFDSDNLILLEYLL